MDALKPFLFEAYIKKFEGGYSYLYNRALARLSTFSRSVFEHPFDEINSCRSIDLPLELKYSKREHGDDELEYIRLNTRQKVIEEMLLDLERIIYIVKNYGRNLTSIKKICEAFENKNIYIEKLLLESMSMNCLEIFRYFYLRKQKHKIFFLETNL